MKVALPAAIVCWLAASLPALAEAPQIRLAHGANVVEIQAMAPNIVRIHVEPDGKTTPRTLTIDPGLKPSGAGSVHVETRGGVQMLASPAMTVAASISNTGAFSVEVEDSQGKHLLTVESDAMSSTGSGAAAGSSAFGGTVMIHDMNEDLYGIRGMPLDDNGAGILRNTGGAVAAGVQGNAGGPFFFTTGYGVLIDSDGGYFHTHDEQIRFDGSRPDTEYFVIVGDPVKIMEGLAMLTGKPPMPPRWTLGFMNSQWGSTEAEWRRITQTYEKENIPISAYILDFDWKAWGEDDYGEWRWNSTSGPGNYEPDKFPDGASGKFAAELLKHGIHLAGILKPRILYDGIDGKPTEASAYATAHHFWYPGEKPYPEYFTQRLAKDIDFSNPEARAWYWQHLEPAFRAGIAGWWDDEADAIGDTVFNNFQFMNMARALYEGQRSVSSQRVWTINRAYYLGAVRYGYAEWSGDIDTGFQSMAYQRRRMVATLDLGEPEWSMDTGGFIGNPTPENYARWIEFAAFVPIFRVHGNFDEKRQPWVFGPVAEAAARKAIRLRYDLIPYIYSYTRLATETGIGMVRPLFWEFPDDPKCAQETSAWMFGDALLVSPIVEHGLKTHTFYMPQGTWLNYFTGKPVQGGRDVAVAVDSKTWQDIPLYVREGSIVATQPATRGNSLSPGTPLVLDVFPSRARRASFVVYDDDGLTYAYEAGDYFRQEMTAERTANATEIIVPPATGDFKAHFPSYLLRVHQASQSVLSDGVRLKRFASEAAFLSSTAAGWFAGADRFGAVTEVRVFWTDTKPHSMKLSMR